MADTPSHPLLGTAAEIIAASLRSDERTATALGMLLAEAGHSGESEIAAACERFSGLLRDSGVLQQALSWAAGYNASRAAAIRRFFLDPSETYSSAELAELWQIPLTAVEEIFEDELAAWEERHGNTHWFRVRWADAVGTAVALTIYRPLEIELALGEQFSRARPEHWRVRPLLIALPQWALDTIASESTLPSTLSIEARVEQLLLLILRGHGAGTAR